MINQRLLEIRNEIDSIVQDLLIPLRTSKVIDRNAFDKFYQLLEEIAVVIKHEENIPVSLVSKLFFVYTSINGEAGHCQYPDPIFMELAKVETYLDKIFRERA